MAESQERRAGRRAKVALDVLIPVDMSAGDGARTRHVRFLDLSEGGMRLSGDQPLPDSETISFGVPLRAFGREIAQRFPSLELKARKAWQKELFGGMWMAGFQFLDPGPEQLEVVREIMASHTVEGAMTDFHLNRPMGVGLVWSEEVYWFYPWVLTLSTDAMEIQTSESLLPGESLSLALKLQVGQPELQTAAVVARVAEAGPETFKYDIEFADMSPDDRQRLEDFMRAQVQV